MTTVEREHAFNLFCRGKSNRRLYADACSTMGIRRNGQWTLGLSERPDCFEMRTLDTEGNYFGATGVRSMFHLIQANKVLNTVAFQAQGIDDACAQDLVEVLRTHPRINNVDLRDNPDITAASCASLLSLVSENTMICELRLSGTRVPAATQRKINQFADRNYKVEAEFFKGDYMRMKQIFLQLDSDASGKITCSELLANIEQPQVAQALMRKFEAIDTGPGRDGTISVNEFLHFTYPDFKTVQDIQHYLSQKDDQEDMARKNYERMRDVFNRHRLVADQQKRLRIPDRELSAAEIERLVEYALQAASVEDEQQGMRGHRLVVSFPALRKGFMRLKKEVGPAWVTETFMQEKKFRMPPAILRLAQRPFDDRKKQLESEAARARPAKAIPDPIEMDLEELLSLENNVKTRLQAANVRLHLSSLRKIFQKHGIPTSGTPMTLQEWITCLDEYYDILKYEVSK